MPFLVPQCWLILHDKQANTKKLGILKILCYLSWNFSVPHKHEDQFLISTTDLLEFWEWIKLIKLKHMDILINYPWTWSNFPFFFLGLLSLEFYNLPHIFLNIYILNILILVFLDHKNLIMCDFNYNHYFILYELKNFAIKIFTSCIDLYNFFSSQLKKTILCLNYVTMK